MVGVTVVVGVIDGVGVGLGAIGLGVTVVVGVTVGVGVLDGGGTGAAVGIGLGSLQSVLKIYTLPEPSCESSGSNVFIHPSFGNIHPLSFVVGAYDTALVTEFKRLLCLAPHSNVVPSIEYQL